MQRQWRFLVLLLGWLSPAAVALAGGIQKMDFTVDGVARTARIYVPDSAKTSSTPVVFVFHGHGGSARLAADAFAIENYWPEAIVVYMQGLNTPGKIVDPQGNSPGWQLAAGEEGDRDLHFFDAVLAQLKQNYDVDAKRVYATGHSNGGGFVYLLWLKRGDDFAAFAPSAAAAVYAYRLKPKPVLIMGGEDDELVKFEWQKVTMNVVRKVNGCADTGGMWEKQCTLYPSATGTPVVTFVYPGGHMFNPASPALIVKFFKAHPGEGGP